jgi:hypothetical protein
MSNINLERMNERHRALLPSLAAAYEEAASICLSRHHNSPTTILLSDNGESSSAEVSWNHPTSRMLDAYANQIDTTEMGAYGCVIAGIELLRGLFAVRRAETGSGADYYIAPIGSGVDDLEDCVRLEISGLNNGDDKEVTKRLLQKVRQASEGNSSLPAVAGVFGFSARLLMIQDVTEDS